ncbi:MAG: HEPN domain-containing protein [Armatimonadetes bacterium]|nr:HEPN domain-containing protein [Armatimonadota bacterium]
MTGENRRQNVLLEWERAERSMGAVETLIDGGFWAEAVSRAYYGMFYLARALLFSAGLETRTHSGVVRQLSLHFARPGVLSPAMVRRFSQMQQSREDADYESALTFDEAAGRQAREALLEFREAVAAILAQKGLLPH